MFFLNYFKFFAWPTPGIPVSGMLFAYFSGRECIIRLIFKFAKFKMYKYHSL